MVTLRDRTELQAVTGELDVVRGLTESLRAQNHEAANRLHTVVSLIEMGHAERAVEFATEELAVAQLLTDQVVGAVGSRCWRRCCSARRPRPPSGASSSWSSGDLPPRSCRSQPASWSPCSATSSTTPSTRVAEGRGAGSWCALERGRRGPSVVVEDSGPGSGPRTRRRVLERGWTTKAPASGGRGVGLALVGQVARRHGGDRRDRRLRPRGRAVHRHGDPAERPVSGARTSGCSWSRTRSWPRRRTRSTSRRVRRLRGRRRGPLRRGGAAAPGQRPGRPGAAGHAPARRPRPRRCCSRLRAAGHLCDVIAVTSARDTDVVRRAVTQGVVLYLLKPFSFAMFRAKLEQYAAYRRQLAGADDERGPGRGGPALRRAAQPRGRRRCPRGMSAETLRQVTACSATRTPGRLSATEVGAAGRRLAGHGAPLPRAPGRAGPGRPGAAVRRQRPPGGGVPLAPLIS